jgi:hypothetical protein
MLVTPPEFVLERFAALEEIFMQSSDKFHFSRNDLVNTV